MRGTTPQAVSLDQSVCDGDEFSHDGGESDFGEFSCCDELAIGCVYWIDSNVWNPLFRATMMSLGSAFQVKGFELAALYSWMKWLMAPRQLGKDTLDGMRP